MKNWRKRQARPAAPRRLRVERMEDRLTPATVVTDNFDYPFGSTAVITGSGFRAGEAVRLQVLHAPGTPGGNADAQNQPWQVTADAGGGFTATWVVDDPDAVGATYDLSAV